MVYREISRSLMFCACLMLVIATVPADEDCTKPFSAEILDSLKKWLNHIFKGVSRAEFIALLMRSENMTDNETKTPSAECDRRMCLGPLAHYEALNCTPVYKDGECCAWQYNCDHLYARIKKRKQKCYVNGHEYKLGQRLRQEDETLCDRDCICRRTEDGLADFNCANLKCSSYTPTRDYCYQRNQLKQCCRTEEICLNEPGEVRPVCKWNGKTYLDDEYIVSAERPGSICVCRAYDKDTHSLLCIKSNLWNDIHATTAFFKGCAPVYLPFKENMTGIHRQTWRCQNSNDNVFDKKYGLKEGEWKDPHGPLLKRHCQLRPDGEFEKCLLLNPEGPDGVMIGFTYRELCRFGQKRMHIGDRLNSIPYDVDSCIMCTCEVPPVPTCILKQNAYCHSFAYN